jgi:hypothetical protein
MFAAVLTWSLCPDKRQTAVTAKDGIEGLWRDMSAAWLGRPERPHSDARRADARDGHCTLPAALPQWFG